MILCVVNPTNSIDIQQRTLDMEQEASKSFGCNQENHIAQNNSLLPTFQLQLDAIISQNGKPIAFYSRKINPSQMRYTTTEKSF